MDNNTPPRGSTPLRDAPAMHNWTEIQTAYHVGRLGTVSAAADYLGVHRATVIRHIDALEQALRAKLFHRHARGYAPTDLGRELIRTAAETEAQFRSILGKALAQESGLSGELLVTSVGDAAYQVLPSIRRFQSQHPDIRVRFIEGSEPLKLEHGEAHVAFRMGTKPQTPDYVVQAFGEIPFGLYASPEYIAEHGAPASEGEGRFNGHRFALLEPVGPPGMQAWLRRHAPNHHCAFQTNDPRVLIRAVIGGVGIGFLPQEVAERHEDQVVQVAPPSHHWQARTWVVTHIDLHRSAKVQSFLRTLRER
ncbi:MAG: LysR family transcriptional regulator [Pseudomonadota bacterium]